MRFETTTILALTALISHVSAFGVPKQRSPFTALYASTPEYDLSVPTFEPKAPAPVSKPAKKARQPKKAPEPKKQEVEVKAPEPKKEKKAKKPKPQKVVEVEQPKPEKAAKVKAEKPVKVKAEKPVKVKAEKPLKIPASRPGVSPIGTPPKSPLTLPAGVILGAAPLIALPVLALLASRTTLQNTKARRDEISAEIAKVEAEKAARKDKNADIDVGGLVKAAAFLGAGVVSLGTIIVGPMIAGQVLAPTSGSEKVVKANDTKDVSSKPKSKISLPSSKPIGSKKASKTPDGYVLSDSDNKVKPVKEKKLSKKELRLKADADAKAEAEAEAKAKVEAEAKAEADAKAKVEAEAKAKIEAEEKAKAEAEVKEAEEKARIQAEAEAAKVVFKKNVPPKKAPAPVATPKAAPVSDTEIQKIRAEKQAAFKAKQADIKGVKEAELKAKIEKRNTAVAPPKAAAPKKAKKASVSASGLGVVKGGESGGKIAAKETLDPGVVDFLKKYN